MRARQHRVGGPGAECALGSAGVLPAWEKRSSLEGWRLQGTASAPAAGAPRSVTGMNREKYDVSFRTVSNASRTTSYAGPLAQAVHDSAGLRRDP